MQKSHFTLIAVLLFPLNLMNSQNLSSGKIDPIVVQLGNKALFGASQEYGGRFSSQIDIYDNSTDSWTTHTPVHKEIDQPSITAGNKIVFYPRRQAGDKLEIYDVVTGVWTSFTLPGALKLYAVLSNGNKVLFVGAATPTGTPLNAYIFDVVSSNWSVKLISYLFSPRYTSVGNKIMIVGGQIILDPTDQVYIYDTDLETWSDAKLSDARTPYATAVIGSKALFLGGQVVSPQGSSSSSSSPMIDIYDSVSNSWTTDTLPDGKIFGLTGVVGNTVVSSDGFDDVLIYNATDNSWSLHVLGQPRYGQTLAVSGTKILIAGGYNGGKVFYTNVDIYDTESGSWSSATLSEGRIVRSVISTNGKIIFRGGEDFHKQPTSSALDIYDSELDEWSSFNTENCNAAIALTDSKLYLAGGATALSGGLSRPSIKVDVYDFLTGLWTAIPLKTPRIELSMAGFANKVVIAGGRTEVVPGIYEHSTNSIEVIQD